MQSKAATTGVLADMISASGKLDMGGSHRPFLIVAIFGVNAIELHARWCSSLLERLQRVFLGVWEKRGCQVHKPKHPLALIVFGDRHSYTRYAKRDLGTNAGSVIG